MWLLLKLARGEDSGGWKGQGLALGLESPGAGLWCHRGCLGELYFFFGNMGTIFLSIAGSMTKLMGTVTVLSPWLCHVLGSGFTVCVPPGPRSRVESQGSLPGCWQRLGEDQGCNCLGDVESH